MNKMKYPSPMHSPLNENVKMTLARHQIINKNFRESIMLGRKPMIDTNTDIHQKWGNNHIVQGSALVWCAYVNNLDAASKLVKRLDVNEAEKQMKWAPIHFAVINGNCQMISYLIENNADINLADIHLETPLHLACWKGHENVVRFLLLNGANPNLKNADEQTPLDVAKKYYNEGCRLLLKRFLKHGSL